MAITPDLARHISKLEKIHGILIEEINTIIRPTVLFTHTNRIEIPDLAEANTNLTKSH